MKRTLAILLCVCLLLGALPLLAFAHSGGTDASGGHIDHSTGEYHYHHGKPAHQHPNGKCPYSSSSSGNSSSRSAGDVIGIIFACLIGIPYLLWVLWAFLSPLIEKVKQHFSKESKTPPPPPQESQKEKEDDKPAALQATRPIDPPIPPPQFKGTQPPPRVSAPPPKAVTPSSQAKAKPPTPPPPAALPQVHSFAPSRALPFASGILEEHPDILEADPAYVTEAQVLAYALSIETPRGKKAVTEQFILENISVDESSKPFRVACSTTSLNSYQQYRTTLVSCSCKDYQTRHLPCKHMIALAIRVNAITVNTEALQKRQERS